MMAVHTGRYLFIPFLVVFSTLQGHSCIKVFQTFKRCILLLLLMAHFSRTKIVGKVDGQFMHAHFGGCRDRFLMRTPYCTLDKWFVMRTVGMLLTLSAACVLPLQLYASLPRTHSWLFSLMSTSSLGLKPPAAMTDG